MTIKRTMIGVAVLAATSILWTLQVGAYGVFTADPPESSNCSQCHTDWPGATHNIHQAFECNNCHIPFGSPVEPSACSACHVAADILTLHSPLEGPGDMAYCGYCHAGVDSESRNWGEVKALFH
jgi:hypothetical protein